MKSYVLKCYLCGKEHKETESVTACLQCGGTMETYIDYENVFKGLNLYNLKATPISALKYTAFYPIENLQNIVSLGEGGTPLVHAKNLGKKLGLKKLYLKNEGDNPTGCFKDRGTMVEVTKAKELNAKAICVASTGNMAASVTAYASSANIPCYVLVPEGTPIGKLAQTLSYGAKVIQIRGTYAQCTKLAAQMAKKYGYYLAGDYTFRSEGQKSQGYEIIEQLFWKSPDYIICPIGCGTNFHGIAKGITEFYKLGLIDKMPKLIGVQAKGCNSVYEAFKKKTNSYKVYEHPDTVAGAMAVGDPVDCPKILDDIRASKGIVIEVDDNEILQAQQEQSRLEGIFGEPASCSPLAAIKQLSKRNFFKTDDTIVCIITGNGLKDPKAPLKILAEPVSIEPDFQEIEKFIEQKMYALQRTSNDEKNNLIFEKSPSSEDQITKIIEKEFGMKPTKKVSNLVFQNAKSFAEKGKEIRKADLQYILEEALNEIYLDNKILEIKDFEVTTSLKKQAQSKVTGSAFGKTFVNEGNGVGPVDAIINAIQKATQLKDKLNIKLIDYEVEIDSRGVDAAVEVKMTLIDNKSNKVLATTSSPDVIVASVKAFEKGFNLLYAKSH